MTKEITIKLCHILIMLWIVVSVLPFTGISYAITGLNSYDSETECRKSMLNDYRVCPDKKLPTNERNMYRAIIQETGKHVVETEYSSGYMANLEDFQNHHYTVIYVMIFVFGLIQLIAFICWNDHYKWFSLNIKSCWDNDSSPSQSFTGVSSK